MGHIDMFNLWYLEVNLKIFACIYWNILSTSQSFSALHNTMICNPSVNELFWSLLSLPHEHLGTQCPCLAH